jgi:hypothetical protein
MEIIKHNHKIHDMNHKFYLEIFLNSKKQNNNLCQNFFLSIVKNIAILWDIALCSLFVKRHFSGTYDLYL